MFPKLKVCTSVLSLIAMADAAQAAVSYSVEDLGALSGASSSFAYAINDAGQVTGDSDLRAFRWSSGSMAELPLPPGASTQAIGLAINRHGDVAGTANAAFGLESIAVVWKSSVPSVLSGLPGAEGYGPVSAAGLNADGLVVGTELVNRSGAVNRAIAIQAGQITELPSLPDATLGIAYAVADSGYIAGGDGKGAVVWGDAASLPVRLDSAGLGAAAFAVNELGAAAGGVRTLSGSDLYRAAVWDASGAFAMIDPLPGMTKSFAFGMNDGLQVVGGADPTSSDSVPSLPSASLAQRAFLWESGAVYDLNTLIPTMSGWHLAQARDINNKGEIVGAGFNPDGALHAFLLAPVPEPHQYLLMLVGVLSLVGLARFKRRREPRTAAAQAFLP